MKAAVDGTVLAESAETVVVEGNHYFPPEAIRWEHLAASPTNPLENCGCFGVHLGQPLRWRVLAQDASFVASAVLARRWTRGPAGGAAGRAPGELVTEPGPLDDDGASVGRPGDRRRAG